MGHIKYSSIIKGVKMDFLDKDILEYRKNRKTSKFNNLQTGIYVNDEVIHFVAIKILEEKAEVMLPDTFVDMPANLAKLKYMSEQRPQIIKTSLDTTVNFTFSIYEEEFSEKEIGNTIQQFKDLIQKVNPAYVFDELVVDKERNIGWFDFKSYGVDEQIYNIMFVKPIDGKLMHGVFNCMYRDSAEWKDAAIQVIYSMKDCTKGE